MLGLRRRLTPPALRRVLWAVALTALASVSAAGAARGPMAPPAAPVLSQPSPPLDFSEFDPEGYLGGGPPEQSGAEATPAPEPPEPPASIGHPGSVRVPVLMYHFIRVNPNPRDELGFSLSVTPADFARQLDLIEMAGYTTVSLGSVVDAMEGRSVLPPRPVVLTFDDGFRDFFTTVLPLLRSHGMTATSFVVTGFFDLPNHMSAEQVREVAALGMTIGAHTVHHVDLVRETPEEARAEITQSRQTLIALTGQPVLDFAYPYGAFDSAVASLVRDAGFRDAVTTLPGTLQAPSLRYELRRVRVSGGESLLSFAENLGAFTARGGGLFGLPLLPDTALFGALLGAPRTDPR